MRRDGVIAFAAKLTPCTMAMEACCGAHHMGRLLVALGHQVRLISPEYVRLTSRHRRMMTATQR
jgi:transposase